MLLQHVAHKHSCCHCPPLPPPPPGSLPPSPAASERVFVPLTVGGGIRGFTAGGKQYSALEVASEYFRWGGQGDRGEGGGREGGWQVVLLDVARTARRWQGLRRHEGVAGTAGNCLCGTGVLWPSATCCWPSPSGAWRCQQACMSASHLPHHTSLGTARPQQQHRMCCPWPMCVLPTTHPHTAGLVRTRSALGEMPWTRRRRTMRVVAPVRVTPPLSRSARCMASRPWW
jgi:hypothetical protein